MSVRQVTGVEHVQARPLHESLAADTERVASRICSREHGHDYDS